MESQFLRRFDESAVTTIAIQKILNAAVGSGAAVTWFASILTDLVIDKAHVHIVGDVKVKVPVGVGIEPRGAGAPMIVPHAGSCGDVGECAVAVVMQQCVPTVA